MLRHSIARAVVASALCAPWMSGSYLTTPAMAQGMIRVSPAAGSGGIGSGMAPQVSSKHVERYADLLDLSADQRAALKDMHQTFLNEQATASALMQQAIDDARAEAEESGKFESFMKVMSSARQTYTEAAEQAKARLFDDLRLLLSPEQEQNWGAVERTQRRAEAIGRGAMSGEAVDIVELVDDLEFPPQVTESLTPVLAAYETSLDTALAERTEKQNALKAKMAEQEGPMAIMQNDGLYSAIREASVRVRDVNATFARQVSDTLPTELKQRFDTEFQRRSFPQVYASTYAERVVDTAMTFDDLTPEQRAQIEALQERLDREVEAANARWAEAVRQDEADPNTEVLIAEQFGMPMEIRMGEEPPALQEARDARSELMSQYLGQVRSLLSPEQQARLPKREPSQRGVGAGGGMRMMVIESTTEGDGHEPPPPPPPGSGG